MRIFNPLADDDVFYRFGFCQRFSIVISFVLTIVPLARTIQLTAALDPRAPLQSIILQVLQWRNDSLVRLEYFYLF
jgi:hypothetical protein